MKITQYVELIPEPVRNKLQVVIDFNCIFWVNIAGFMKPLIKKILWSDILLNDTKERAVKPVERLSQEMLSAIKVIKTNYYTEKGTVDYDAIKDSREYEAYRKLTAGLRNFDLNLLKDEKEGLAFWINLYNTIVVDGIIALGIKSSVKEVIGFFSKVKYIIGGYRFSPDDIEHGILRENANPPMYPFRQFRSSDERRKFSLNEIDHRIHFALVCGSRSCAPIKFYTPEGVYDELELASLSFINSAELNVSPEEGKVTISRIFKWYKKDFCGTVEILTFLEKYLMDDAKKEFLEKEKQNTRIDYLYYDWNLNK